MFYTFSLSLYTNPHLSFLSASDDVCMHPLICLCAHTYTYSSSQPSLHPSIHPSSHSSIHPSMQLLNFPSIYPPTRPSTHSSIHLPKSSQVWDSSWTLRKTFFVRKQFIRKDINATSRKIDNSVERTLKRVQANDTKWELVLNRAQRNPQTGILLFLIRHQEMEKDNPKLT